MCSGKTTPSCSTTWNYQQMFWLVKIVFYLFHWNDPFSCNSQQLLRHSYNSFYLSLFWVYFSHIFFFWWTLLMGTNLPRDQTVTYYWTSTSKNVQQLSVNNDRDHARFPAGEKNIKSAWSWSVLESILCTFVILEVSSCPCLLVPVPLL